MKGGNNSYKLKNKIPLIAYLHYQHNKITKKLYNNLIMGVNIGVNIVGVNIQDSKLVIITEPKIIHFDLPKDVGNNLKDETHFIIKYIEFLVQHTIKNKIS